MTKIAIVYHSGYGHTAKVADAVAAGAKQVSGADVTVLKADSLSDADWTALDNAHAIIFGSPTYMGGVSGPFKTFLDATSSRWMTRAWQDKLAAGFTNSGSLSGDKLASLQQMITTAMQHGMIWVGQSELGPMVPGTNVPDANQVNRMGSYSGLMTQSNQESPEIVPPAGDLKTANIFGQRVATLAAKLSK